jgi:hypothetical protein
LRTKHGDAGTVIDYRNWQIAVSQLHVVENKRTEDKR